MTKTQKTDVHLENKKSYDIPALNISISSNWLRLILWVSRNIPHGQVCYKIERGEPTELVAEFTKKKVRFDKDDEILPENSDKI
jgi:hypothetical protein